MTQFLVIRALHEPTSAEQIVHEPVESDRVDGLQGDVPLVARPGFALPPVARTAPWTGLPEHATLHFFFLCADYAHQFSIFQSYGRTQRRTEHTQSGNSGFFFCRSFLPARFRSGSGHEASHAETFGTVRVKQFQRTHV